MRFPAFAAFSVALLAGCASNSNVQPSETLSPSSGKDVEEYAELFYDVCLSRIPDFSQTETLLSERGFTKSDNGNLSDGQAVFLPRESGCIMDLKADSSKTKFAIVERLTDRLGKQKERVPASLGLDHGYFITVDDRRFIFLIRAAKGDMTRFILGGPTKSSSN